MPLKPREAFESHEQPRQGNEQTAQLTTLTCGESTISSPDKALVLQFANFVLGGDQVQASAANSDVPAIGEYWPGQGGVYAGVMRGEDRQPDYHLIVPTAAAVLGVKLAWGDSGEEVSDCAFRRDGMANNIALMEGDHPAAQFCANLEVEGCSDFYLPAISELALCMANVPELFDKEWHWSSTQRSANLAFSMTFGAGFQYNLDKSNELRVRPVRRLPI